MSDLNQYGGSFPSPSLRSSNIHSVASQDFASPAQTTQKLSLGFAPKPPVISRQNTSGFNRSLFFSQLSASQTGRITPNISLDMSAPIRDSSVSYDSIPIFSPESHGPNSSGLQLEDSSYASPASSMADKLNQKRQLPVDERAVTPAHKPYATPFVTSDSFESPRKALPALPFTPIQTVRDEGPSSNTYVEFDSPPRCSIARNTKPPMTVARLSLGFQDRFDQNGMPQTPCKQSKRQCFSLPHTPNKQTPKRSLLAEMQGISLAEIMDGNAEQPSLPPQDNELDYDLQQHSPRPDPRPLHTFTPGAPHKLNRSNHGHFAESSLFNDHSLTNYSDEQYSPVRRKNDSPGALDDADDFRIAGGSTPLRPQAHHVPSHSNGPTTPFSHISPRSVSAINFNIYSPKNLSGIFGREKSGDSGPARSLDLDHSELDPKFVCEFSVSEVIGNGSFGTVYKCVKRIDGWTYAVKKSRKKVKTVGTEQFNEIYALAALADSPHIVRYYSSWVGDDGHIYIQMEYCDHPNLDKLRRDGMRFSEDKLCEILRQMALALKLMHGRDIAHLDIKPENICENQGRYVLLDLGLCVPSTRSVSDLADEGDCRYLSREILQDSNADLNKADIFALGISIYELAVAMSLPKGGPEYQSLRDGHVPFPPGFSPDFMTLIRSMMNPNPALRPTAKALLETPLLVQEEKHQAEVLQVELNHEHSLVEKYERQLAEKNAMIELLKGHIQSLGHELPPELRALLDQ